MVEKGTGQELLEEDKTDTGEVKKLAVSAIKEIQATKDKDKKEGA
jgi:hypothetical protein